MKDLGAPHLDQQGGVPGRLMEVYNHSSYEVKKRYLGVAQDDLDRPYLVILKTAVSMSVSIFMPNS